MQLREYFWRASRKEIDKSLNATLSYLSSGQYKQSWAQLEKAVCSRVNYYQLAFGLELFFAGYKTPAAILNHRPVMAIRFNKKQEETFAEILEIMATQDLKNNFAKNYTCMENMQYLLTLCGFRAEARAPIYDLQRICASERMADNVTQALLKSWKNLASKDPAAFLDIYDSDRIISADSDRMGVIMNDDNWQTFRQIRAQAAAAKPYRLY